MSWLRGHRLQLVFAGVLLALAANSAVMYRSISLAARAQEPLVETLQLLREIDALRNSLIDSETGRRGYVITGDPAYLEPYYSAVSLIRTEWELLNSAIGNDPDYAVDMAELDPLIVAKVEELDHTIELRRRQGFNASRAAIDTGEGKRVMDAIRGLIDRLEQRTNDRLLTDSARAAESTRTTLITFLIGTALTLGLLVLLFRALARDVVQRRSAETVLKDTNDRLALGVAALEQRNRQVMLLSEMSGALQSCLNLEEAYEATGTFCRQLFPECSGTLYVMQPSRNYLDTAAAWGGPQNRAEMLGPEDCWALRRGEAYQVRMPDEELVCKHVESDKVAPYMCLPLQAQGEILGLLYFEFPGSRQPDPEFFGRTRQLAVGTGKQIALALANIRLRETLRRQSVRDALTGLFNRRYLEETLDREVARAKRGGGAFCVVMIDVDHFKPFNDDYGHEAGDLVLREIGALLRSQTRGSDTACRYGGEEFTLILGDSSPEGARRRCDDLREMVRGMNLSYRQQALGTITVSMGVAAYPNHGREWEALLRAADQALYRAKREGRDRVVIADAAEAGAGGAAQTPGQALPG